jgi:hypothetical protein
MIAARQVIPDRRGGGAEFKSRARVPHANRSPVPQRVQLR